MESYNLKKSNQLNYTISLMFESQDIRENINNNYRNFKFYSRELTRYEYKLNENISDTSKYQNKLTNDDILILNEYINNLREYEREVTESIIKYNSFSDDIESYIENPDERSEILSEVLKKGKELSNNFVQPPRISSGLSSVIKNLNPQMRTLFESLQKSTLNIHAKNSSMRWSVNNLNILIEEFEIEGKYHGADHVEIMKSFKEHIKNSQDYIDSQKNILLEDGLTKKEVAYIKSNILNAQRNINSYIERIELRDEVFKQHGITNGDDINISPLINASIHDTFDSLTVSIAGFNIIDTHSSQIMGVDSSILFNSVSFIPEIQAQ